MNTPPLELKVAPFGLASTGEVNRAHPSQKKILDWADRVRAKTSGAQGIPVLYAQGGWRSGKTSAVLAVIQECMQEFPGVRVLIGRKDFNDLRLSTMETWKQVRNPVFVLREDKQEHREEWINGSQVFFRELKDLEGLGGQEFGIILVSEPYELEEGVYFRLKGRISQKGMPHMLLLEGNPPNAGHWLHRVVVGDEKTPPDPDLTFMEISTDENWGNLPEGYKRSIEQAPASWQKKYRLGQWGFTPEGQPVYELFKEHIHVFPGVSVLVGRPVIRSFDSGARHPACLWVQTTPQGQLLVQYEWLGMETSLVDFAKGVILRTNEWYGDRVVQDYGDPAMFARSPQTGKSDAAILQENHGIQLHGRASTHQDRKSLIDRKLSELVNGSPAVLVHPRCRTLIDGLLGGYHYPKREEGRPFSHKHEIPFKDSFYEHLANCWEYAMVNIFGSGHTLTTQMLARRRLRMRELVGTQGAAVW